MTNYALPLGVFFAGLFLIVGSRGGAGEGRLTLEDVRSLAIQHISKLPKGSMIVFDFDDTLFDPRTVVDHVYGGNREFWSGDRKALPLYKPIVQICDILRYAAAAGMYITLITARKDTIATKQIILQNFKKQKMVLHEYHANNGEPSNKKKFKARLRKNIEAFRPIGLTVGDQWGDVQDTRGSTSTPFIKLPNAKEPILLTSLK